MTTTCSCLPPSPASTAFWLPLPSWHAPPATWCASSGLPQPSCPPPSPIVPFVPLPSGHGQPQTPCACPACCRGGEVGALSGEPPGVGPVEDGLGDASNKSSGTEPIQRSEIQQPFPYFHQQEQHLLDVL